MYRGLCQSGPGTRCHYALILHSPNKKRNPEDAGVRESTSASFPIWEMAAGTQGRNPRRGERPQRPNYQLPMTQVCGKICNFAANEENETYGHPLTEGAKKTKKENGYIRHHSFV